MKHHATHTHAHTHTHTHTSALASRKSLSVDIRAKAMAYAAGCTADTQICAHGASGRLTQMALPSFSPNSLSVGPVCRNEGQGLFVDR